MSDELVDAYRLPQLVRGWEIGLVRFVRARVAGRPVLTTVCGVTVAAGHFHAELAYLERPTLHCCDRVFIAQTTCNSCMCSRCSMLATEEKKKRKRKEKKISSMSTLSDAHTTVIGAWIGVHALLQHL